MPADQLLTDRTRATREKLLAVARQVFEEDGFDGASISRIVELAGVSRGTFYLYFDSKEDVFRTLATELLDEVVALQEAPRGHDDPLELLRDLIARYVVFYRAHALFMAVLEQVGTHNPDFRDLRRNMRRGVADQATRLVRSLQRRQVVARTVDAHYAAVALTGMVDRFLYVWLVLGESFSEPEAVENLARLWFQAIGGQLRA